MSDFLFGVKNVSFFDSYWAAIHFGSGLVVGIGILAWARVRSRILTQRSYARIGVAILALWEYFELFLRFTEKYQIELPKLFTYLPRGFFEIESLTNVISDLVMGGMGLLLIALYTHWHHYD